MNITLTSNVRTNKYDDGATSSISSIAALNKYPELLDKAKNNSWNKILHAISFCESDHRPFLFGDGGDSAGAFQFYNGKKGGGGLYPVFVKLSGGRSPVKCSLQEQAIITKKVIQQEFPKVAKLIDKGELYKAKRILKNTWYGLKNSGKQSAINQIFDSANYGPSGGFKYNTATISQSSNTKLEYLNNNNKKQDYFKLNNNNNKTLSNRNTDKTNNNNSVFRSVVYKYKLPSTTKNSGTSSIKPSTINPAKPIAKQPPKLIILVKENTPFDEFIQTTEKKYNIKLDSLAVRKHNILKYISGTNLAKQRIDIPESAITKIEKNEEKPKIQKDQLDNNTPNMFITNRYYDMSNLV